MASTDKDAALSLHNQARKEAKGATRPALTWDDALAASATAYAHALSRRGVLAHDPNLAAARHGENLYWSSSGTATLAEASRAWLAERERYRGEAVGARGAAQVGHYTQMVWPGTTRVGMASVAGPRGTFVVARYAPRGNVVGQSPWGEAGSGGGGGGASAGAVVKGRR